VLGSQDPTEPVRSDAFVVSGDFTTWFQNQTYLDDFIAAQSRKIKIIFEGDVITGGSGAYKYTLQFEMEVAKLKTDETKQDGKGRIMQACSFSAYRSATYAPVLITVLNNEPSL